MAQVAVALHLEPAVVWAMDPKDLATVIDVLEGDGGDEEPWLRPDFELPE